MIPRSGEGDGSKYSVFNGWNEILLGLKGSNDSSLYCFGICVFACLRASNYI